MSFVNPAFSPCEQGPSAIRTAFAARTRDIWHTLWITLVDLGVNWVWYCIGLFGGPQMRILGGSIMKVNIFCDFTLMYICDPGFTSIRAHWVKDHE